MAFNRRDEEFIAAFAFLTLEGKEWIRQLVFCQLANLEWNLLVHRPRKQGKMTES